MKTVKVLSSYAACWMASLSLAVGLLLVSNAAIAQSSDSAQQDMWNPAWMQRDRWSQEEMSAGMRQRMARHWAFMHEGVPAAYAGARNPFAPDPGIVAEGRELYQANCAVCHGPQGMGDGDTARALNPSPALLAYMIQVPITVDEYMLWAVSEGGAGFDTAMPAFRDSLTRDEIWKIVTFMRMGFPLDDGSKGN